MKVLHVYRTYFPDPPGGLQEAIRQIALSTAPLGTESRIFTLSPIPNPKILSRPEGKVVRFRCWLAPASCDLGGVDALRGFREQTRWCDVVHLHFPWPFADTLLLLGGLQGKTAVMTYHSDVVRQKYLALLISPLLKRTVRQMSAVAVTSETYGRTSEFISREVSSVRLKTIPLGMLDYASDDQRDTDIEKSTLGRLDLHENQFLLSIGVLRYYKGLHSLIKAAQNINFPIVIAGSGPEEMNLKKLARSLNVTNIIFAGQISEKEKFALLRHCRALVLPSHLRSEAFGMVLVEASMFSKPMVCCEVGSGTSYVNQHGVTGFVVAPESAAEFARACNSLVTDPSLACGMGAAARARYELLFSSRALGTSYRALYEDAIRDPVGSN